MHFFDQKIDFACVFSGLHLCPFPPRINVTIGEIFLRTIIQGRSKFHEWFQSEWHVGEAVMLLNWTHDLLAERQREREKGTQCLNTAHFDFQNSSTISEITPSNIMLTLFGRKTSLAPSHADVYKSHVASRMELLNKTKHLACGFLRNEGWFSFSELNAH